MLFRFRVQLVCFDKCFGCFVILITGYVVCRYFVLLQDLCRSGIDIGYFFEIKGDGKNVIREIVSGFHITDARHIS
ncbi:hypothetical protein D3C80_1880650 [compost metagenome]